MQPPPVVAAKPAQKLPRWLWPVVAGLAGLMAILLAAVIVYRIKTDTGELVVETEDPNIEVVVTQAGKQVTIIDPQTKTRVELHSGQYEVELAGGKPGLTLSTQQIRLTRGDKTVVTVRREPPEQPETTWVSLQPGNSPCSWRSPPSAATTRLSIRWPSPQMDVVSYPVPTTTR